MENGGNFGDIQDHTDEFLCAEATVLGGRLAAGQTLEFGFTMNVLNVHPRILDNIVEAQIPFTGGEVDTAALASYLDRMLANGIHNVALSHEQLLQLTCDERARLVGALGGRDGQSLYVDCSSGAVGEAAALAQAAAAARAVRGLLVCLGAGSLPWVAQLLRALRGRAGLPVYVCVRRCEDLGPGRLRALHEATADLAGVVCRDVSAYRFNQLRQTCGHLQLVSGDDRCAYVNAAAAGVVCSKLGAAFYALVARPRLDRQQLVDEFYAAAAEAGCDGDGGDETAVRAALAACGSDMGPLRPPYATLGGARAAAFARRLRAAGILDYALQ